MPFARPTWHDQFDFKLKGPPTIICQKLKMETLARITLARAIIQLQPASATHTGAAVESNHTVAAGWSGHTGAAEVKP